MTQSLEATWWSRECGGRDVLRIALPMVASTMSWTLMSFIDSAILFRVSAAAMSAAFNGALTWFALLSLFWGLCSYGSTFVSQYYGDDQPEKIGAVVWQGVWLAVFFTPLAIAAMPLATPLFELFHKNRELSGLEAQFFRILCWGAPGMLAAQSLEAFYSGRGKTYVVMCVDAAAVLVNLVLACVLVLGWGGFTESLGIAGAAWATVSAQWFRAASYATLALMPANRVKYNTLAGMRFDPALLKRLLRYGGPSGVQMMLDIIGFNVFVLMVGRLGMLETEATSMAFRVSHVAFMPVWGVGIAASVLVGQKLGEDRPELAKRATMTALGVTLAYMGFISALFVLSPNLFLQAFAHEGPGGDSSVEVLAIAAVLMRFVAAYNLFDAVVITFVSALKGAGDTKFIMRVSVVSASLLTFLTWLCVERLGVQLYGCWTLISAFVWSLAVVYAVRFWQGKWRAMRVIEQVHHAGPGHGDADGVTPLHDRPRDVALVDPSP